MRANNRITRRQLLHGSLAFGALVAAGCRPVPSAGPAPTLNVWLARHPYAPAQATLAQQVVAAAREDGATAAIQADAGDALFARISAAVAAKQAPDVALVGSAHSAILAARGWLVEVRDVLDRVAGLNGDLFPPLRDLAGAGPFVDLAPKQKPPAWAIPAFSLGVAWLARRDLLAAKGMELPASFDQVRAAVGQLSNVTAQTFGWGAALPLATGVDDLLQLALLDEGGRLFDPDGLRVVLNPADAAAALGAVAGLYRADDGSPLAPPGVVDWSSDQTEAAFAAGKTALTIDYGGSYARLVAADPKRRGTIQAFAPPAGAKARFTAAPTLLFGVFAGAGDPARGRAFVERLLQPGRYDDLIAAGQGSVIPPYAYLTKTPFWDQDANYTSFVENARGNPALNLGYATPGSPGPMTSSVALVRAGHALATALRAVALGEQSASAAASALAGRCQALATGGPALQPAPTPTPEPGWLKLISSLAGMR